MEFTAKQIAELLNGRIEGDENVVVNNFSKIEEGKPKSLSFLANPKYTHYVYETEASIILVNNDFELREDIKPTLIRVPDSYKAIADLLNIYNSILQKPSGVEKNAQVHKKANLGKNIYIGAFSYISEGVVVGNNVLIYPGCYVGNNVKIGDNTVLYSGVKVYYNTIIGENCIIHAGSVIGADGFGFAPTADGTYSKIAQIGNVIIENNVELGALVTIDRATMGSTIIREGVKLDNHNHIAHNVEVDKNTVMAAQCGVAGSAKIGKDCMFGGQVGIAPHISIADRTKLAATTAVSNTISAENKAFMGAPAFEATDYRKSYVYFKKLPDIVKRLEKLEKILKENNITIED
jgi:UDP-3-O-[3-hydroxymyristoyl] glucosamine N-acyltransferase